MERRSAKRKAAKVRVKPNSKLKSITQNIADLDHLLLSFRGLVNPVADGDLSSDIQSKGEQNPEQQTQQQWVIEVEQRGKHLVYGDLKPILSLGRTSCLLSVLPVNSTRLVVVVEKSRFHHLAKCGFFAAGSPTKNLKRRQGRTTHLLTASRSRQRSLNFSRTPALICFCGLCL